MKNATRLARDSMLIWMNGEKSGRFVGLSFLYADAGYEVLIKGIYGPRRDV